MDKKAGKILSTTGIAIATAAAASVTSYLTTKYLVRLALDRQKPRILEKAEDKVSRSVNTGDFIDMLERTGDELAEKSHMTVEMTARDGTLLIGHWFAKKNAKRTVIAMHGWRSSWYKDFGMISDFLLENECNVLFAEQRGQNESGGDYMGFGLIERYDCLDWVNWLNEKCGDDLPVYLCGVSMGATTVLMATGLDLPTNVHGVMADCGFTSPYEIWKHVANNNLHISFGIRGAVADALCKRKINFRSKDYSTVKALKKCNVPVLFIHGTDDNFVPIRMTYDNYKACAAPKKLLVVPGADHGMSYYMDKQEYEDTIKNFWEKYD